MSFLRCKHLFYLKNFCPLLSISMELFIFKCLYIRSHETDNIMYIHMSPCFIHLNLTFCMNQLMYMTNAQLLLLTLLKDTNRQRYTHTGVFSVQLSYTHWIYSHWIYSHWIYSHWIYSHWIYSHWSIICPIVMCTNIASAER